MKRLFFLLLYHFSKILVRIFFIIFLILTIFNGIRAFSFTDISKNGCPDISALDDSELEKHLPPVLDNIEEFDQLKNVFNMDKPLALLLDFDGTLADINTTHTNYTVLTEKTRNLLNTLVYNPKVFMAFISGRNLGNLKEKIELTNKTYSGNHGLEIEFEDGTRHDYQLSKELKDNLHLMIKELREKVTVDGSWVEDKGLSTTYYYRNIADEQLKKKLTNDARNIIKSYGFRVQEGHQLIEGKPPINWQKGESAIYILKHKFGENWCNNVNIIFTGDDNTDEDAMKTLHNVATTFRIHDNETLLTYATYRFPQRKLVDDLLHWVIETFA